MLPSRPKNVAHRDENDHEDNDDDDDEKDDVDNDNDDFNKDQLARLLVRFLKLFGQQKMPQFSYFFLSPWLRNM